MFLLSPERVDGANSKCASSASFLICMLYLLRNRPSSAGVRHPERRSSAPSRHARCRTIRARPLGSSWPPHLVAWWSGDLNRRRIEKGNALADVRKDIRREAARAWLSASQHVATAFPDVASREKHISCILSGFDGLSAAPNIALFAPFRGRKGRDVLFREARAWPESDKLCTGACPADRYKAHVDQLLFKEWVDGHKTHPPTADSQVGVL